MIPIITQILPHTTCSGRGEVMLRCEKNSLTEALQIQIKTQISPLLNSPHDRIIFDTQKDPIADRIYLYAEAVKLDQLTVELLQPLISELKTGMLTSIYFAYEEGETQVPNLIIDFLAQNGLENYLLSA